MQNKFIVTHNGEQLEPMYLEEIQKKVQAKEIDLTDFIFAEEQNDWVLLVSYQPFLEILKRAKPTAPPKIKSQVQVEHSPVSSTEVLSAKLVQVGPLSLPSASAELHLPMVIDLSSQTTDQASGQVFVQASIQDPVNNTAQAMEVTQVFAGHELTQSGVEAITQVTVLFDEKTKTEIPKVIHLPGEILEVEWFILKGDNRFGPFSHMEVVKLLQEKSIFEYDYAWNKEMKSWARIAELSMFHPDEIRRLRDTDLPEVNEAFFRRRHARVNYGASVLVHDNQRVWKGQSVEISAGGAGVVLEGAQFVPGQRVFLHFKPGDGVPPFNAVCEIVNKKFKVENDPDAPVQYGLRFIQISRSVQKELDEFTKKNSAA